MEAAGAEGEISGSFLGSIVMEPTLQGSFAEVRPGWSGPKASKQASKRAGARRYLGEG